MSDWLVRLAPPLGRGYLRLIGALTRFRIEGTEALGAALETGPVLSAVWHNRLLGPVLPYRGRGVGFVVSKSRDGELATRLVEAFGYVALRGSSSRGGAAVARAVLRHLEGGFDAVITPDGPKGPRYEVHPGVAYLAVRSGVPLVPIGVGMSRKAVFRSWDRFQVPLPFGTIQLVMGEPRRFGQREDLGAVGESIRAALAAATERADRLLGVTSP